MKKELFHVRVKTKTNKRENKIIVPNDNVCKYYVLILKCGFEILYNNIYIYVTVFIYIYLPQTTTMMKMMKMMKNVLPSTDPNLDPTGSILTRLWDLVY